MAVDASPRWCGLARERPSGKAQVRQADLGRPLTFLADASFDLVLSPLVLDYLEDGRSVFGEFHRVLRPGGLFVFLVGHPLFDFTYFKTPGYFVTKRVRCE